VTWGTLQALSKNLRADIIYHKGDIGKEPMIITVFCKNPGEVAAKIKEILKNYWTLLAAPELLRVTRRVTLRVTIGSPFIGYILRVRKAIGLTLWFS
jgi:hypothetical protein